MAKSEPAAPVRQQPAWSSAHDPTSSVQPGTVQADVRHPPPRELAGAPAQERRIVVAGAVWLVRVTGRGVVGTGSYNLGLVEAVHFERLGAPGEPLREVLLARGEYMGLADDALAVLCGRARPITTQRVSDPAA